MNLKKRLLKNSKLYAVTDLREDDSQALNRIVSALDGGVDIIQLRSKTVPDAKMAVLGLAVRKAADKLKKLFIINDRVDLALAVRADGVHLGQYDLPIKLARSVARGVKLLIGKSTHSLEQALKAEAEGADYIGFGPIFQTPTKPDYEPVGLEAIGPVMKKIKIPVVCIGGIGQKNIRQVLAAGAGRVAVVRAVFGQEDTFEASRQLKTMIERC